MKNHRRTKPPKTLKPIRNFCLMFLCGAIMMGGFFFAARQHFASMDYGMKNSKLRRQLDELEAEKRRLLFNREVSVSPSALKRSAKKAGLFEESVSTSVPQLASASAAKQQALAPAKASLHQPERKLMVVKTAAVKPVHQATTAVFVKEQKTEKLSRRSVQAE